MDQIPHEVIIIILSYLEYIDIYCLCTSKKKFYYLLYDNLFWKNKIYNDFAHIADDSLSDTKKYNYKSYLNLLFNIQTSENYIDSQNVDTIYIKLKHFIYEGNVRLIKHLSDKGVDFIEMLEYTDVRCDKTIITNIILDKIDSFCLAQAPHDDHCWPIYLTTRKNKSNYINPSKNGLKLFKVAIKYKLESLITIFTDKLFSLDILCFCHQNVTFLTSDQKRLLNNFYFGWAVSNIRINDLIDFIDSIDDSFIEFLFYGSCFGGNLSLVKILLSRDNKIILKNYHGLKAPYIISTAINYAASNNKSHVVNYLLSLKANPYSAIDGAIDSNHPAIVINILDLYGHKLTMYKYIMDESFKLNRPDVICSLIYKYNNHEYLCYLDKFKNNQILKRLLNDMNGFISTDHLFVKLPLDDNN